MLSNGSVMQSFGETNCGSIGPPTPIESTKDHCPWPACVVNALKVQTFDGLALGDGDGDAMPLKIERCTRIENSVPVPLLFRLYENCVRRRSQRQPCRRNVRILIPQELHRLGKGRYAVSERDQGKRVAGPVGLQRIGRRRNAAAGRVQDDHVLVVAEVEGRRDVKDVSPCILEARRRAPSPEDSA